jgi:hypothetical protein
MTRRIPKGPSRTLTNASGTVHQVYTVSKIESVTNYLNSVAGKTRVQECCIRNRLTNSKKPTPFEPLDNRTEEYILVGYGTGNTCRHL